MPEPIQSMPPIPHCPAPEATLPPPPSEGPITTMGLVEAPMSLSELAVECAAKLDDLVISALTVGKNPLVGLLSSAKAGWEILECATEAQHEANVQATVIECTKKGGTPIGTLQHSVSCQDVKP